MARDSLEIRWNKEAENLLRRRGNYTLEQIQQEFQRDPKREAMVFDMAHQRYVTPVAGHRYSVVWRLLPDQNVAEVSAVVPTRFAAGGNVQALKERVKRVVTMETQGRVTLEP